MTLRKAKNSDAAAIAALTIEVWIGTYLKRGVNSFFADYALSEFTVAKTEALIADPRHSIIVSDNQDGIDGLVRITSQCIGPVAGCSDSEIATLYVQPRHHGKGIGKKLLEAAVAHCREMGATSAWLTTNAENAPAIAFYLRQGFEQVGVTHFTIKEEGYLNNVYSYRIA